MTALRNFLFLKIITVDTIHYWILVASWVVLVLLGLWSLASTPRGRMLRVFWAAAIIFLPGAGLFAYVATCLIHADWEVLRQMGFFSKTKKKIVRSISVSEP